MRSSFRVLGPAFVALTIIHCTPDFDALGDGEGTGGVAGGGAGLGGSPGNGGKPGSAGGVAAMGGVLGMAGTTQGGAGGAEGGAGPATGGSETGGSTNEGGSSGSPSMGGDSSAGAPSTGGTASGGSGGSSPCALASTTYTGFDDKSLQGPNIVPVGTEVYLSDATNLGGKVDWAATEGKTCPGSFRLTATFKAYQSTTSKVEAVSGIVDLGNPSSKELDWSAATRLHVSVKVPVPNDYLQGVQVFVTSSGWAKYRAQFDAIAFKDGDWHEIVIELPPDSLDYDGTKVDQFGIQALLAPAPPATDPPTLPVVSTVYIDDVWLDYTP